MLRWIRGERPNFDFMRHYLYREILRGDFFSEEENLVADEINLPEQMLPCCLTNEYVRPVKASRTAARSADPEIPVQIQSESMILLYKIVG